MYNQPEPKELKKIRSLDDADQFFWWMSEHPEVTEFQGWAVERPWAETGDNRVAAVGTSPRHSFTIEFIYTERKIINDWIDRKLKEAELERLHRCFGYAEFFNTWDSQWDQS